MSRIDDGGGVLETIYSLAGVTPPRKSGDDLPRAPARGAAAARAAVFYGIWPALVDRRRRVSSEEAVHETVHGRAGGCGARWR
jgi:hypothetical protein